MLYASSPQKLSAYSCNDSSVMAAEIRVKYSFQVTCYTGTCLRNSTKTIVKIVEYREYVAVHPCTAVTLVVHDT
jgi:hypothetical protein